MWMSEAVRSCRIWRLSSGNGEKTNTRSRSCFLDSSDEVLIKRFKETRRSHPLSRNGRVEKGIELEREKLAFLKKEADQVIDTSRLLTKELRHELENLYSEADGRSSMFITVVSFGFKYGIPADADLCV